MNVELPQASGCTVKAVRYPWETRKAPGFTTHTAGQLSSPQAILEAARNRDIAGLSNLLATEPAAFGFILETPEHIVAATDRVRGYPVYVREHEKSLEISDRADVWVRPECVNEFDEEQAGRFLTSGYTLEGATVFSTVRRLMAGEILVIDKATRNTSYSRYYIFCPTFEDRDESSDYWEDRVEAALDGAVCRTIAAADGTKIWIPLSAGYDSRAVLAKLLALGYDNIQAFSYGEPGNMESRVASEIADKAGVSWQHIPSLPLRPKQEFRRGEVTRYLFMAAGLGSAPVMSEYFPLQYMLENAIIREEEFVVNGQSGDYLTGGHIPNTSSLTDVADFINRKHFQLFPDDLSLGDQTAIVALLQDWCRVHLGKESSELRSPEQLIALYLAFEYQERQCDYVVQQERAYDYFGLRWTLPLWDGQLMDVFQEAPIAEHVDQALYLRYLRRWNFRGLFEEGRRPYNPWPRYGFTIRTLARLAGLVAGKSGKDRLYKRLHYWSDLHAQYALFGLKTYQALNNKIRNPVSLYALEFLARLREALGVSPRGPLELHYAQLRQKS